MDILYNFLVHIYEKLEEFIALFLHLLVPFLINKDFVRITSSAFFLFFSSYVQDVLAHV